MKSKAFVPFYFAILSLAEGSGSQCKGIEEEKCSAFIKFFDPQPNILKTVKDSLFLTIKDPFQKIDPKALFDQGLTCLQYDSYASPAEAYNLSDPVVLNIENEIMSMDEMNDMKKEISLTRKSSTFWSDSRLKWPDDCGWDQEAYLLDVDLDKIWTPTFMHTGMKYQLEKSDDAQAKSFWEPKTGTIHMEQVFYEKHACQTHLDWYPFDHVKCQIIQSLVHPVEEQEFNLLTKDEFIENSFFLPGFLLEKQYSEIETRTFDTINTTTHSTLVHHILFKRLKSNEVMHTFMPSMMLAVASASSVYIAPDQLPARMGLCATTFLSMIALFKGSSDNWPKTDILKAIDVWAILCYAGAFFCLIEYSVVLYLSKKKEKNFRKVQTIENIAKIIITLYTCFFPTIFLFTCTLQ